MRTIAQDKRVGTPVRDRSSVFEAAGLDEPPAPMQIFVRLGVLVLIAIGSALAAQWLFSAPL
jgi:hypothetical protein